MSTDQTPTIEQRSPVEDRVERIATYWGRALVDAWRVVFPRRDDTK